MKNPLKKCDACQLHYEANKPGSLIFGTSLYAKEFHICPLCAPAVKRELGMP